MSMNLYVEFDNVPFDLWQTPTYITKMCLSTKNDVVWELSGSKAKRALQCYKMWVQGQTDGAWNSHEELQMVSDNINEHIRSLEDNIKLAKKIYVYQM